MAQRHLPALLIIMDGCGLAPADGENAVAAAKTPFHGSLYEKYPHTTLGASGRGRGVFPTARWATPRWATSTSVLAASCSGLSAL